MNERLENCQRQRGMDCRGCGVAVDVAVNVLENPESSVVDSILEVTREKCPDGTKFLLHGDLRDLVSGERKVIKLKRNDGELRENRDIFKETALAI